MRSHEARTNGICMLMFSMILGIFVLFIFAPEIEAFIEANFTLEFLTKIFKLAFLIGWWCTFVIGISFFVYAKIQES